MQQNKTGPLPLTVHKTKTSPGPKFKTLIYEIIKNIIEKMHQNIGINKHALDNILKAQEANDKRR